jgi:hypothetical protein
MGAASIVKNLVLKGHDRSRADKAAVLKGHDFSRAEKIAIIAGL